MKNSFNLSWGKSKKVIVKNMMSLFNGGRQIYLSKDESTIVKGLAIILIVIGHNPNLRSPAAQEYLYSFHIYVFFILPFFYQRETGNLYKIIKKTFIRCLVPFFWFYTLAFLVANILLGHGGNSFSMYIKGLLNFGGQTPGTVSESTYLWFMPAYFWMIVMWAVGERVKAMQYVFLILSALLSINNSFTWHVIYAHVPFYVARALYYYFYAWLAVTVSKILKCKQLVIWGSLFLLFSLIYYLTGMNKGYEILMPCIAFNTMICVIRRFDYPNFIKQLGQYSFLIYIFHMYFYFICEKMSTNVTWLYLTVFIALIGSLYFSMILKKCKWVYNILFPSI